MHWFAAAFAAGLAVVVLAAPAGAEHGVDCPAGPVECIHVHGIEPDAAATIAAALDGQAVTLDAAQLAALAVLVADELEGRTLTVGGAVEWSPEGLVPVAPGDGWGDLFILATVALVVPAAAVAVGQLGRGGGS